MNIESFKFKIDCIITATRGLYDDRDMFLDFIHQYLNGDFKKQRIFTTLSKDENKEYEYLCDKNHLHIYIQKRNQEIISEYFEAKKKAKT